MRFFLTLVLSRKTGRGPTLSLLPVCKVTPKEEKKSKKETKIEKHTLNLAYLLPLRFSCCFRFFVSVFGFSFCSLRETQRCTWPDAHGIGKGRLKRGTLKWRRKMIIIPHNFLSSLLPCSFLNFDRPGLTLMVSESGG